MALDSILVRATAARTISKEVIPLDTVMVSMDVMAERVAQVDKGYTAEHDDKEGVTHLLNIAQSYAIPVVVSDRLAETREHLVKQIATLVAAVEVIDRAVR